MKKYKRKRIWSRYGRKNKHHIINKCRDGKSTPDNLLVLDIARHDAWHFLFGNMSFQEVVELLKRTLRAKVVQNESLKED